MYQTLSALYISTYSIPLAILWSEYSYLQHFTAGETEAKLGSLFTKGHRANERPAVNCVILF